MNEIFADLHVHIGRSENGKPIKITAALSLNFANIAKECADRKMCIRDRFYTGYKIKVFIVSIMYGHIFLDYQQLQEKRWLMQ